MDAYLGEIAALTTAVCWTFTAIFFTQAGRRVGSVVVNRMRLVFAVIFLATIHWLVLGTPLPLQAAPERWFWLGLSGIVGLTLGDAFLFQSYVWVGPRLGMLMMSLAPVISAVLAWFFLGETLAPVQIAGIGLTIGGVAWVVLERGSAANGQPRDRNYTLGVLAGLAAATGQALGLILAKKGLAGDFPALSGNLMRMLSAMSAMWLFTILRGQAGATLRRLNIDRLAARHIIAGSVVGPFIGVWLSLIAIQLTQVGIASTLMALPPVLLLPISYFFFKEPVSWRAIGGTAAAIVGVAILFLV